MTLDKTFLKTSTRNNSFGIYFSLTKPGIIFGNAVTAFGGFALASSGGFNIGLFIAALVGLSLIVAAGCVFNNYIDREMDKKMERTKGRALASGLVSIKSAILFANALALFGIFILGFYTNVVAACVALSGLFVYVALYSPLKYRTLHATLIGSIAGAVPPIVGYCAVSSRLDLAALILFAIVALWQMPHFFAIAIYRMEEYAAASVPVLPLVRGMRNAKIQILLYICAFMAVSSLLTLTGFVKYSHLIAVELLGAVWLWLGVQGFKNTNNKLWARKMFLFSLIVIMGVSIMIPLSIK